MNRARAVHFTQGEQCIIMNSNEELERLGIPPSELVNVAREREFWGPLLELPPRDPTPDKRMTMRRRGSRTVMQVLYTSLLFG